MNRLIAKNFDHNIVEDDIYKNWEKSGHFKPEYFQVTKNKKSKIKNQNGGSLSEAGLSDLIYDRKVSDRPFVIMMPPPNVTGKLHIGHSLVLTLEDIMTRYHRLLGEQTLWLPGMDHAGIATQTVVDKQLRKEGINKNDLGRDKFIEKVWQWKKEHGDIILEQTRKMGASCDWSRERFTLDEGMSNAVREAFVALYSKGLIYRGEYIVNWCPKCRTAIADDEVMHKEQETKLYYFKYDKKFPIMIATTRPETKLGDTAVAVNPNDKRYKQYIGKEFSVVIDGLKRKIKIIADRAVDPKFGTGAVGVTPAHSAIDWRMAEEQKLPIIKVIDENGRMTKEAGHYQGLKAKEAAEKLLTYLKKSDLLEKEEDYLNNLSICYRCNTSIEPLPSLQWFVKMKPLADKARTAVKTGQIKIIPKRFEKIYFHWLANIRDWCISRQLWWGHQIPVYYRKNESIPKLEFLISNQNSTDQTLKPSNHPTIQPSNQEICVGVEPPKDIENWEQDPDVLDTWFSSALWPFATLGWPKMTSDFKKYYPNSVMETGYDIIFFWVARMIMFGLELTGKIPFETVYLHGMVRDEQNRKMSKSLGNSLDPLDIIPKYGTDALRMALVVGSTPGQDIAVGEAKIKGYRNFSNKIWNASRFVILRATDGDLSTGEIGQTKIENLKIDDKILTKADQEILKLHAHIVKSVTKKIDDFKISQAGEELYEYFWHKFCDHYIEQAKEQLAPKTDHETRNPHPEISENTKKILIKILSESLIMLHPFTPFVTEAVWQELRQINSKFLKSIMISNWPRQI